MSILIIRSLLLVAYIFIYYILLFSVRTHIVAITLENYIRYELIFVIKYFYLDPLDHTLTTREFKFTHTITTTTDSSNYQPPSS